jgi:Fe-S-cluster-containing dehydrogenase component
MEKCTFCVQRIELAKSTARREGRALRDGEIKTACQSACPAEAIYFGDINNPNSEVSKQSQSKRGFKSLEELNTKPSITYLTRVWNRAPKEEAAEHAGHGGGH